MPKTFYTLCLLLLGLAFVACQVETEEAEEPAAEETGLPELPPTGAPAGEVITATFQPAAGAEYRNISGNVTVMPGIAGGDFQVAVDLQGLPAGEHAWHIHGGACSVSGSPVAVPLSETAGMPGITSALSADASGNAQASATVPAAQLTADQLRTGDYALHVHARGGTNHGPSIACADL